MKPSKTTAKEQRPLLVFHAKIGKICKFPAFFSFSKERKAFPQFMSRQTGIVMNNQMDDFASPNIGKAPFFLIFKKRTYILFWNTIPEVDFKNPEKIMRKPKISRLLPNLCESRTKSHRLAYRF